jgi:hypothetical protein
LSKFLPTKTELREEGKERKFCKTKSVLSLGLVGFVLVSKQESWKKIGRPLLELGPVIGGREKGRTKPSFWLGFEACVAGDLGAFGNRILGPRWLQILGTN